MAVLRSLVTTLGLNSAKYRSELKRAQGSAGDFRNRTRQYMRDTQKSLNDTGRTANTMNRSVSTSFRNAASAVAVLDGPLGGVAGRMSSLGSTVGTTGLAFGAAAISIAAVATVLGKAISVGQEYERQQLRTQQLLKATDQSVGFTANQMEQQARSLALATLASTEGVRDAQATLLTFRSISGETFTRTITLAQDMAATFGGDLKSATLQLGKALEDPATGLTALRRSGVSFTDAEREMITSMYEAGQAAEAQAIILDKLEQQVGGAGAAEGGGLAGTVDTLGQSWDEFLESLNKTLSTSTTAGQGLNILARGLQGMSEYLDPAPQVRLNNLMHERLELQEKINTSWDPSGNRSRHWQNQINAINEEIRQIQDARKQQIIEEGKAQEAGARAEQQRLDSLAADRERREQEQAAKTLAKQHQQSAALVSNLEMQLASQEEKIILSHDRRVEQIQALALTEEQIEATKYSSLAALQAAYIAQSEAAKDAALERLKAKESGTGTGSTGDLDKLREKYTAEETLLLEKTLTEQEILLNAEAQKQISEQESQLLRQQSWDAYYEAVSQGAEQAAQRQADAQARANQQLLSMQLQMAGNAIGIIKQTTEEGSALWVASVIAQQTLLASQAIMQANLAAATTRAAMIIPGNPASVPAATAMAEKIRFMGYANAAMIAAQGVAEIAGAREKGGEVRYGQTYLVGERGPELFTAGATGQITSNDNLQKAMGGQAANQPIQQITFAPQIVVESGTGQDADAAFAEEVADRAYVKVYEDIVVGGDISKALGRS